MSTKIGQNINNKNSRHLNPSQSKFETTPLLQVKVGDSLSQPYIASSGVPLGSHLDSMLFLIYIQDLVEFLGGIKTSLYADDLKLSRIIKNINDSLLLQSYLTSVKKWDDRNQLELNSSKCQSITFNRTRRSVFAMYHLGAAKLKRVSEVKDLGVILDAKLDFSVHIDRSISKCRAALGLIYRFAREFGDPRIHKFNNKWNGVKRMPLKLKGRLHYTGTTWDFIRFTVLHDVQSYESKLIGTKMKMLQMAARVTKRDKTRSTQTVVKKH